MQFKGFTLDPFQEEAARSIDENRSVVVSAPTGSGKTLVAEYVIDKLLKGKARVVYTAPIKALSNQKYRDFTKLYGDDKIGLMTGDIVINPTAQVVIMTTEIYRNMMISRDEEFADVGYVIFDEVHYINDIERGYVWEESIIYSSEKVRFLCLSATIPNAQEFADWIAAIKNHTVDVVVSTKRNVPLDHSFYDAELGITSLEKIKQAKSIPEYSRVMGKRGKRRARAPKPSHVNVIRSLGKEKLPCFYFAFSRRLCQQYAKELGKKNFFKQDSSILVEFNKYLESAPEEINKLESTQILKQVIGQGIAFHHAGLLPVLKEAIENLFGAGKIRVLYTTETFAVGINMPAKTVCFDSLRKYDGRSFRSLNTKEYFQIAGRAGRRGIDTHGYVVSVIYRPTFNYKEVKRLTAKDVEPIKSQFRLSVNTVLNLINLHTPEEIEHILRLSFYSYQKFGTDYAKVPTKILLARYNSIVRKLKKYAYVTDEGITGKGKFASRIYADEISTGEVFATEVVEALDEYQILLILGCLSYEPRDTYKFKQPFRNEASKKLKRILRDNEYLSREKKFLEIDSLTTLINPVYNGKDFFDVLELTNLLEGDLIRIYTQILDRLGQIIKVTTNEETMHKLRNSEEIIKRVLEGIYLV